MVNKNLKNQIIFFIIFYFVYKYFNKSKFKNIEHKINKISLYSLSSFSYTLTGLIMLKLKLKNKYYQNFFPYFMIIQGFISYSADVIYFNKYNIIHDIDKAFATYNFILCCFIYKLKKEDFIFLLLSIYCFKKGNYYFLNKNYKKYKLYHILWHFILPLTGIKKLLET